METTKFFEKEPGNKSSGRLMVFVIVIVALIYSGIVLWFGRENVMLAATAAGTLFSAIAGPAMIYLFQQKKNE